MLERLRNAAMDVSPSGRETLLRLLGEAVFSGREANHQEMVLFSDIALAVLPRTSQACREHVSDTLADLVGLPRALVDALATDVPSVAAPILSRLPDLNDDALVDYALRLSDAHRAAIATRAGLAARVSETLVRLGNVGVVRAVAENAGAHLNAWTVHRLVELAAGDDDVCQVLSQRNDLPQEDADQVVLLVAKRLRDRWARPVEEPPAPSPEPTPVVAFQFPKAPLPIGVMIAKVRSGEITLDQALSELARHERNNDVAALLCAISGIDEMSVLKVLVRADAIGIINVVRALDVSEETWADLVQMRQKRLRFSKAQARFEKEDFAKVSPAHARQTLSQFSGRKKAAG